MKTFFIILLCFSLHAENAALLTSEKDGTTNHSTATEWNGKLLTCAHSIKDGGSIKVQSSEGWINCTVVRMDKFLDLCLLKPEKKIHFTQRETNGVTAFGAPGGEMQAFPVKLVDESHAQGDGSAVDFGISGGCVLDAKGKLVGIIRGVVHRLVKDGRADDGIKRVKTNCLEFVPAQNVKDFLDR